MLILAPLDSGKNSGDLVAPRDLQQKAAEDDLMHDSKEEAEEAAAVDAAGSLNQANDETEPSKPQMLED